MDENLSNMKKDQSSDSQMMSYIIGGAIILMGIVAFININNDGAFVNWALIGLVIPIGFFALSIFRDWQNGQGIQAGKAIGLIGMLIIGAVFFFGLEWGTLWPIYMALGGLAVILSARNRA